MQISYKLYILIIIFVFDNVKHCDLSQGCSNDGLGLTHLTIIHNKMSNFFL